MTVKDADLIAELRESAETLRWLINNSVTTGTQESDKKDFEAINSVIVYYGGDPVSLEEEVKSAEWADGYAAGHEAGFKNGFERGAYEQQQQEDADAGTTGVKSILPNPGCKCGCK